MISRDIFCQEVCGGKCCTLHLPDEGAVPCPQLGKGNRCGVYKKRFAPEQPVLVKVGNYRSKRIVDLDGRPVSRPFFCTRIEALIAVGGLPAEIAKGCVYVHPELLEEKDEEHQSQP